MFIQLKQLEVGLNQIIEGNMGSEFEYGQNPNWSDAGVEALFMGSGDYGVRGKQIFFTTQKQTHTTQLTTRISNIYKCNRASRRNSTQVTQSQQGGGGATDSDASTSAATLESVHLLIQQVVPLSRHLPLYQQSTYC